VRSVPLFGSGIAAKSYPVTRQRRLNVYLENRPDGDKTKIAIFGTPGLNLSWSLPAAVRGILGTETSLYAVAGSLFYQLNAMGGTIYSTSIATSAGFVSMANSPTQQVVVDGVNGYLYSGGVLTTIAPWQATGARTVTFVGGYFVAEQPGTQQFWVSNLFDGSTWNPLALASASQYSDNLIAVDALSGNLILFSNQHTEFWQNVGTSPQPFAPILAATSEYGLLATWSRAHLMNSIICLAENPQGTAQVVRFAGYQANVISTPDLENLMTTFQSDLVNGVALSYVVDGHPMYQISFPVADTGVGRSFLYDVSTGLWSETQTGLTANAASRHTGNLSSYFSGSNLITDFSNGNVYTLGSGTYTDNTATIQREIVTRHVLSDFNVLTVDEVYIDMETGVGLNSGQGSNPQIMLQVSKDNGRTWQTERWVTMGALGAYSTRVIWRQFGSGRDFTFRLKVTDPIKFVITEGAMSVRERPQ
jgi:hypothetical protein